jgi:hypothetical protein
MKLQWLAGATAVLITTGAAASEDMVPYEVQRGESLYVIAERLLEDVRQWPEVARLNRLLRPSRLQPGQRLLLPASLLKGTAVPARVEYVRGPVRADGAAMRIGDTVTEGAALEVGAQGFVSLRLHDGSLLQLQANSRSKLLRLRDLPAGQRRNTLIELDQGRVDATVTPQSPGSRFQVKTPLATAGVRGTRFGVSVPAAAAHTSADVVEGRVEVQAAARGVGEPVPVDAGMGAVVRPGEAPVSKPLLPAPDLSSLQGRVERVPAPLPLTAIAGATHYRVEIADDDAFTRVLWSAEGPLPIMLEGLPDGRYRLRARAIDADELLGKEASGNLWIKTTPVPPLAQAPQSNETVGPDHVQIECTEVPQAAAYLLQMATNARFEPLLREEQGRGRCRFELRELPVGEVYWRVATLAPESDGRLERGPFADLSRFVVVPLPPVPRAEDIVADGQQVHWVAQEGYRYRVQVATDTAFGTVVQDEEVRGDRLPLALPPRCVPYALRMQAIDANGRRSAFSPPRLVNTDASVCSIDGSPVQQSSGERLQLDR